MNTRMLKQNQFQKSGFLVPVFFVNTSRYIIADVRNMANKTENDSETDEQAVGNESSVYYVNFLEIFI